MLCAWACRHIEARAHSPVYSSIPDWYILELFHTCNVHHVQLYHHSEPIVRTARTHHISLDNSYSASLLASLASLSTFSVLHQTRLSGTHRQRHIQTCTPQASSDTKTSHAQHAPAVEDRSCHTIDKEGPSGLHIVTPDETLVS